MDNLRDPRLASVLTRKQIDSLKDKIDALRSEYLSKIRSLQDQINGLKASCDHVWGAPVVKNPDRDPGEAASYEHTCEACDHVEDTDAPKLNMYCWAR